MKLTEALPCYNHLMGIRDSKEKHAQYLRAYYLKNKDRIKERARTWAKNNPDKIRASNLKRQEYERTTEYKRTPNYVWSVLKDNSRMKGRSFDLSREDFVAWYEVTQKVCSYCGVSEDRVGESGFSRLEIDRIENSLPYQTGNLALACHYCNRIKRELLTAEEMRFIGKHVILRKWNTD